MKSNENAKTRYNCKQYFKINLSKIKNIVKLEKVVIIKGNLGVLHIAYVIENIVCLQK